MYWYFILNVISALRRFPYLLFWQETYSQTFSHEFLWVQFLKKNCVLTTFEKSTFCRGFYEENDRPSIYGENSMRNYNQIRTYAECSPNQSKKLYLIGLSIKQSTKLWEFPNSAGRVCISILTEYCSSALTTHAFKMIITTLCVQIDNCFCNTWLLHLCVWLRWFPGTLV